jgi:hypothetical protein
MADEEEAHPRRRWAPVSRRALLGGLACNDGGARIVLLAGKVHAAEGPAPSVDAATELRAVQQPVRQPR